GGGGGGRAGGPLGRPPGGRGGGARSPPRPAAPPPVRAGAAENRHAFGFTSRRKRQTRKAIGDHPPVSRREWTLIALAAVLVLAAGLAHYLHANDVLAFLVAAGAIAVLAHLVGVATEQLGGRVGPSSAGVIQSGLGNLP